MRKLSVVFALLLALTSVVFAGDAESLRSEIENCENNKNTAHQIAEFTRSFGYPEGGSVIKACSDWWWSEHNRQKELQAELDELEQEPEPVAYTTEAQRAEYPIACQVWEYLRGEMGMNTYVAAGVMGNMMTECGGQTLDLDPYCWYAGNYYGLCQWSVYYYPETSWMSTEEQLDFLRDSVKGIINMSYGNYDYFMSLNDAEDAAWYFCKYYERPGFVSQRRLTNAMKAYNYFA